MSWLGGRNTPLATRPCRQIALPPDERQRDARDDARRDDPVETAELSLARLSSTRVKVPAPKPPLDWKEARRLYVDSGLAYAVIARTLGYAPKTVARVLREHGIAR